MLLIIKSMDLLNTIDNERYIFIVNIYKINYFYYYFYKMCDKIKEFYKIKTKKILIFN